MTMKPSQIGVGRKPYRPVKDFRQPLLGANDVDPISYLLQGTLGVVITGSDTSPVLLTFAPGFLHENP